MVTVRLHRAVGLRPQRSVVSCSPEPRNPPSICLPLAVTIKRSGFGAQKAGAKSNQKLHQWTYAKFRHMLEYKAELRGMTVEYIGEAYTSQTCPSCQNRYKPSGRKYRCPECGFEYHRDGVGAINIRAKYLGSGPVVGVMASPTGLRYRPHVRGSSHSGIGLEAAFECEKEPHAL